MKEDYFLIDHDEESSRDALPERRPHLPQTSAQRVHQWLTNRPLPLNSKDVCSNRFLVGQRKTKQPFTDWLVSGTRFEKQSSERTGSGRSHMRKRIYFDTLVNRD